MKNKIMIFILVYALFVLAGCMGDHSAGAGKDTVKNTYSVAKDTSKMDTSKTTSADHTAAGGADLVTDTAKKAKTKK